MENKENKIMLNIVVLKIKEADFLLQQSCTDTFAHKMSTFRASSDNDSTGHINDLFDLASYDLDFLDIGSPSQWMSETATTNHAEEALGQNDRAATISMPPHNSDLSVIPAVQSHSTGLVEDFMATSQTLTKLINDLTAKVDILSKQVDDLQKRVAHTSANVGDLDKTLLEVLKRERMAMDKFGDISSRFQGAFN